MREIETIREALEETNDVRAKDALATLEARIAELEACDVSASAPAGWEFVNLFNHVRAGLFYCRIRHSVTGDPSKPEITGDGPTPRAALEVAIGRIGRING